MVDIGKGKVNKCVRMWVIPFTVIVNKLRRAVDILNMADKHPYTMCVKSFAYSSKLATLATLERSLTNVPSATNHSHKLLIWESICTLTMERRSTLVNNVTNHSVTLSPWRYICWLTVERKGTVAPIATNLSVKLEIWRGTFSSTLEKSLILAQNVTNHLGKQEVWGLIFWFTLVQVNEIQLFDQHKPIR